MDRTTEAIAAFAAELSVDRIPDRVIAAVKGRLVDSLGCAIAALDARPAQIARSMAADARGSSPATAIGLAQPTTVELAAFANTVMVRFLDFNDTYFTARGGGGHPSDLIPTALAVGQATGASGLEVMRAIVVGYEVVGGLATGAWLRERGWDQGLYTSAAASMMAGTLLGLDVEELGHALSLAVTPNVPVRQTRVGRLSMWKGCATAGAARTGIFAALLARKGMTGPPGAFEGASGIFEQVTGPFEIELPVHGDSYVVEGVHTKLRPAEYNAQGPLDLVLDLRTRVAVDQIESIEVETYYLTYHEIGSDPAKWAPETRETADHSLPYLLAVALVDGFIDESSCGPARIADPALRPLMAKIRIRERKDYTARFPAELPNALEVRLRDGTVLRSETAYPRGHQRNPVTGAEIDAKFDRCAAQLPGPGQATAARLRDDLRRLDEVPDIRSVMEPLGGLEGSPPDLPEGRR
jgi:2-methylcitrate dehydratase